jgi:hypothetical protein
MALIRKARLGAFLLALLALLGAFLLLAFFGTATS